MKEKFHGDPEKGPDPVTDVEQLLGGMSLKSPSESLDQRIGQLHRPAPGISNSHWGTLVAVAVSFLLTGFFLGQFFAGPPTRLAGSDEVVPVKSGQLPDVSNQPNDREAGETPRASDQATSGSESNVRLIDEGLFLLNGKLPVRRIVAVTNQRIRVIDPESGKPVEMTVPVKRAFVTPSTGT